MKTEITTSDIYFVAALLAVGAKIKEVDKSDTRHIRFTVQQDPLGTVVYEFKSENLPSGRGVTSSIAGLEYYETQWLNGIMMVNAISYKNAIQQVKTIVHST